MQNVWTQSKVPRKVINLKHQDYLKLVLLELQKMYPKSRFWQAPTGTALSMNGDRILKFGIDGQADITASMYPNGRRAEIEIKVGKDKQRESQKNFEKMITATGALYIIVDDKKSIEEQIKCLA